MSIQPCYSTEVLPGRVQVEIFKHIIDVQGHASLPCWTYISKGLTEHFKHPEVVLTIHGAHAHHNQGVFLHPIQAIAQAIQTAASGKPLTRGAHIRLAHRPLGFDGLIFAHPQPIGRLPIPDDALCARLAFHSELDLIQNAGPLRLLALWGFDAMYYPFPPWSNLDRQPPNLSPYSESLLNEIPGTLLPQSSATIRNKGITLNIHPQDRDGIKQRTESFRLDSVQLLFWLSLDPDADGLLVWKPNSPSPVQAVTAPGSSGSRLTGCFLRIIPNQATSRWSHSEDGFDLLLSSNHYTRLRQAIDRSQPLQLPFDGDQYLELKTAQDASLSNLNPIIPTAPQVTHTQVPAQTPTPPGYTQAPTNPQYPPSGAYPAAPSGGYPAAPSGGYPQTTPTYPITSQPYQPAHTNPYQAPPQPTYAPPPAQPAPTPVMPTHAPATHNPYAQPPQPSYPPPQGQHPTYPQTPPPYPAHVPPPGQSPYPQHNQPPTPQPPAPAPSPPVSATPPGPPPRAEHSRLQNLEKLCSDEDIAHGLGWEAFNHYIYSLDHAYAQNRPNLPNGAFELSVQVNLTPGGGTQLQFGYRSSEVDIDNDALQALSQILLGVSSPNTRNNTTVSVQLTFD